MRRRRRSAEFEQRLSDVMSAWNDYPPETRGTLMIEWPALYIGVSRLVRYEEVTRR